MTEDFEATGLRPQTNPTHPGKVRLVFERGDESRAVMVPRAAIPQFVAALMEQIEPGAVTPMRRPMELETQYRVTGFDLKKHPTGAATMTVQIEFAAENRTMTLPLPLSPDDVRSIVESLGDPTAAANDDAG